MTSEEAAEKATAWVADQWGFRPDLTDVRPPHGARDEWRVAFKTVLPGGHPDEVVDGPTVVLVHPTTGAMTFIVSM